MSEIRSYKDLIMWQRAKDFAVMLYRITEQFPRDEIYGLTNQLRRAGVSVASNIAEGFSRRSSKEKAQFLRIAYGSCAEIQTQLTIAGELQYLNINESTSLINSADEIMRMVNTVLHKL